MVVFNLLMALLINAVPVYGITRLGWSVSTVLVLYWVENLAMALVMTLRIVLHRQWTRKRGHWREQTGAKFEINDKPVVPKTFLTGYLGFALVFTVAHGVFVFVICAILAQEYPDQPEWHISLAQLQQGGVWIIGFLLADLLLDLPRLRTGSFAWLKKTVEARQGRVLVLHLAIIFGMWIMFVTESPFGVIYMLIALKTLFDVATTLSSNKTVPSEPPQWALALANKTGGGKGDNSAEFTKQWKDKLAREKQQASEDEEVLP
jgi:hypothetical protein